MAEVGLVTAHLLRRYDCVEMRLEAASGALEKVVVHVGENHQTVSGSQLRKRGDSVWKRRPSGQARGESGALVLAEAQLKISCDPGKRLAQHLPVRSERT